MELQNKKNFAEVVIVEGRDDTKRLQQFFPGIETIETNGSEISELTLAKIAQISLKRPIIILTDPDFNGERIRRKVLEVAPTAKQAFITREDAVPSKKGGSLGVEHASQATLEQALTNLHETQTQSMAITWPELIELGLVTGKRSRILREYVGQSLKIGYANAKQFSKRLQTFGISYQEVKNVVEQWSMDEKTSNR